MRLLFSLDSNDYKKDGTFFERPSSRAIYIKNGLVAMVHSLKYDYYKFPGGGINKGESNIDALIRETKEEAGLIVVPSSIKEFGLVLRVEKDNSKGYDYWKQENYYYLVDVEEEKINQNLDDYEADEQFTLEFVDHKQAIKANRRPNHGPKSQIMIEREAKVLEILDKEGYFNI